MAPHTPSALFRSAPSGNMFITIDSAAGSTIAAPGPCTQRIGIGNESVAASPQASEAAVKTNRPIISIRRHFQQVRGAAAEQQEAAEGQRVAGNDPLQARFRHVQLAADGRQRDVDDREVRDRHEEQDSQHRERAPAADLMPVLAPGRDGRYLGHVSFLRSAPLVWAACFNP